MHCPVIVRLASALPSCDVVSLEWLFQSRKGKTPLNTQAFLLKRSNSSDTHSQSRKRKLNADSEGGTRRRKRTKVTRMKKLCMPIDVRYDTTLNSCKCSSLMDYMMIRLLTESCTGNSEGYHRVDRQAWLDMGCDPG